MAQIENQISDSEYEITWQTETAIAGLEAAWHAPNRAQGFRTYFTSSGIHLVSRSRELKGVSGATSKPSSGRDGSMPPGADPRPTRDVSWELALSFVRFGRIPELDALTPAETSVGGEGGSGRPVPGVTGSAAVERNTVSYAREGIVEWYRNDRSGLEQGFTLSIRPAGPADGGRTSEPAIPAVGPEVTAGRSRPSGPNLVGIELALGGTLSPVISEDALAIDFATPQGEKVIHYAALAVRDARGDRLPSWMEGFNYGGTRGIRIVFDDRKAVYPVTVDPLATGYAWSAVGGQAGAAYGYSVATAGDVNRDGYSDVIVGAFGYDNGQTDEGRAYIYLGSASGLATSPAWTDEGNNTSAVFGYSVATAGDVNGDGYSDVLVGAYQYTDALTQQGAVFVYLGSPAGLILDMLIEGDQANFHFGYSVASAGDVNGDGFSDVIIGAHHYDGPEVDEGIAVVLFGSPSGLTGFWSTEGNQTGAGLGASVSTAGDVNGDGYADVIVGAYHYDNAQADEGRVYVFLGSASGPAGPVWTAESDQASADFGISVSTAGDVNGDGYSDVIVGSRFYDNVEANEGRAFVYLGSASGLAATPAWTAESNQAAAQFGYSVATAGDVNGDGYADVLVGAYLYDNGQSNEGRASLYFGSASGPQPSPAWTAESDQADADFGCAVATAGDVNGDGYADVIVGAYHFDATLANEGRAYLYLGSPTGPAIASGWTTRGAQASSSFGFSVATAGDVNGDGYTDVIVGAPSFDIGQGNEGRAFLYQGSTGGLAATPAWTAESDQAGAHFSQSVSTAGDVNGDGYDDVLVGAPDYPPGGAVSVYRGSASGLSPTFAIRFSSDQADSSFGSSVARAGDTNGDSFSDIIIGAQHHDNPDANEGAAYVYFGSQLGLTNLGVWTAEGNQAGAGLGSSVGTAGDVNGDGFSDVIIGADGYSNGQNAEGRALVYLGSASGLGASPAWTAESNQALAQFGISVGTAGDVNGDRFSDIIVGANGYSNGQGQEGRAYVYLGSGSGPGMTAAWTGEGDLANAWFGYSVATAGDVNGDGYADVVVGAPLYANGQTDEGRAYVYLGSVSGLATTPAWTAESDQATAAFGVAVASAGDVNGDGYADVIVGAYLYDNVQSNEGQAFLYYGNGGPGMSLDPRQRHASDAAPIAYLGASDTSSAFRLAMTGRSPFGRTIDKLEWEVKPLGTLFNGLGTGVSSTALDTGTGGAALNESVPGLAAATAYHWRVRARYDSARTPLAQRSRWLTMPWNGWQETKLRTASPPAGRVPDRAPGAPLLITKAGASITLTWGASCTATDTDYEVYEGTIGSFYSHIPKLCTTAGARTATLAPSAGKRYYLVVPRNANREGSYGLTSSGSERPQTLLACFPQSVGACSP